MKALELKEMENFEGGVRFSPTVECGVAAIGFGLGIASFTTGVGIISGLGLMASTAGALTTCFPY